MDIICDTNVWYRIGKGKLDPAAAKQQGGKLFASPVSFLEIGSKIWEESFEKRRNAARAVLQHADGILEDPERHLARIWALKIPELTIDWRDGFKAIADAGSMDEIEKGVADFQDKVIRKINLPLLAAWRDQQWQSFEADIIGVIDSVCPGYAQARATKKAIHMDKAAGALFRQFLACDEFFNVAVDATRQRVALHLAGVPAGPTPQQATDARAKLALYAKAYAEYLFKVATKFAPRPNDWGDIECLVYVQDGRTLLTFDDNWAEIVTDAGFGQHLFTP